MAHFEDNVTQRVEQHNVCGIMLHRPVKNLSKIALCGILTATVGCRLLIF